MKHALLKLFSVASVLASAVTAHADCVDLSGAYEYEDEYASVPSYTGNAAVPLTASTIRYELKQQGCESITVSTYTDGELDHTEKVILDGKPQRLDLDFGDDVLRVCEGTYTAIITKDTFEREDSVRCGDESMKVRTVMSFIGENRDLVIEESIPDEEPLVVIAKRVK